MTIRDDICTEALSWVKTPYHHEARIKQVGVDCAQLLIGVFSTLGLIPEFDTGTYPPDWHLHRGEEVFLAWVEDFAYRIEEADALPGDLVMFKYGRCFSHGAIIIDYPTSIVHAVRRERAVIISGANASDLDNRERLFYRLKAL